MARDSSRRAYVASASAAMGGSTAQSPARRSATGTPPSWTGGTFDHLTEVLNHPDRHTDAGYWLRVSTQVGPTSKLLTLRGFGAAA